MKIGIILFAIILVVAGLIMLGVYLKKKGGKRVPNCVPKTKKKK